MDHSNLGPSKTVQVGHNELQEEEGIRGLTAKSKNLIPRQKEGKGLFYRWKR